MGIITKIFRALWGGLKIEPEQDRPSTDGRPPRAPSTIAPVPPSLVQVSVVVRQAAPEAAPLSVPSSSWSSDQVYGCDLHRITCTCPDFRIYREVFPVTDSLRPCKHLRGALVAAGLVHSEDPEGTALWEQRGGRLFKWSAPGGIVVFLSIDPTRDWITVAPVKAEGTGIEKDFGWSVDGAGWSYGTSPKGIARGLKPVLQYLMGVRADDLRALGPEVARRWSENRAAQEAREQEAALSRERQVALEHEGARSKGLVCGVCAAPLGMPWGTSVGTELPCSNCGFRNIVVDGERADAVERALIDWKYYGDPRPGGAKGLLTEEKERHNVDLEQLSVRSEAGDIPIEQFASERDRLQDAFHARFNALHQRRHEELGDVRRRISNVKARLTRRARVGRDTDEGPEGVKP